MNTEAAEFASRKTFRYDVGMSYASEQRDYVHQVAEELTNRGAAIFYDQFEEAELWGEDLYVRLSDVFQNDCHYCVVFVSQDYAVKRWPQEELRSAFARTMEDMSTYLLPARFDDTPIPGLKSTIGFVDIARKTPNQLCDLIMEKLGRLSAREFIPSSLDRLIERLRAEDAEVLDDEVSRHVWAFMGILKKMNSDERNAVVSLLRFGCPYELPKNVHINADLLERVTGLRRTRLEDLLGDVESLGFRCSIQENESHDIELPGRSLGVPEFFYLNWTNLNGGSRYPGLPVAYQMIIGATEGYCEEHGTEFLERLDFSQLSSKTATREATEAHD